MQNPVTALAHHPRTTASERRPFSYIRVAGVAFCAVAWGAFVWSLH